MSELRTLKTLEMSRAGPCVRYRGSILASNIAKYYSSPLQTSIGGEPGLFAMSQHIARVRVGDGDGELELSTNIHEDSQCPEQGPSHKESSVVKATP